MIPHVHCEGHTYIHVKRKPITHIILNTTGYRSHISVMISVLRKKVGSGSLGMWRKRGISGARYSTIQYEVSQSVSQLRAPYQWGMRTPESRTYAHTIHTRTEELTWCNHSTNESGVEHSNGDMGGRVLRGRTDTHHILHHGQ